MSGPLSSRSSRHAYVSQTSSIAQKPAQCPIVEGMLPDLNGRLCPAERTYDTALHALCEEKLYFYGTYEKWHDNYYTMRDTMLAPIPWPLRLVVGQMVYRQNMAMLHGQGTGRFTAAEIFGFKRSVWQSLEDLLAEAERTVGHVGSADRGGGVEVFWALAKDHPTEADAVLFGFVVGGLVCTAYVLELGATREVRGGTLTCMIER